MLLISALSLSRAHGMNPAEQERQVLERASAWIAHLLSLAQAGNEDDISEASSDSDDSSSHNSEYQSSVTTAQVTPNMGSPMMIQPNTLPPAPVLIKSDLPAGEVKNETEPTN